ncbi:MAG: glycosyltransferase [Nostoc sp.]|uniref:glycosyltransferase n=1 Tax=Nostoc sp. TaxID=1180 RepID=UPI002FF445FE
MKPKQPTQGVIYFAVDAWPYLESAVISAFALRQVCPQLPIIIFSNIKCTELQEQLSEFNIALKPIVIPEKERLNNVMVSRVIKTSLHTFTVFDETLYLDADILPIKPIDEIWGFFNHGNIAMVPDPVPKMVDCANCDNYVSSEEKDYTLKTCAADLVQFNSGLILWKNTPDAYTLFETWQKEWRRFKQQDQLALSRTIQETKNQIVHLPYAYNYPGSWFAKIYPIEQMEQRVPDLPELNDIKMIHFYNSYTLEEQVFNKVARRLMPDATEKAVRCLQSSSKHEFDVY